MNKMVESPAHKFTLTYFSEFNPIYLYLNFTLNLSTL